MSGDKVLRLELESKQRCDDVNFMKKFVGNIVNDAKIAESIEKISYSCCSSSCCNYNATSGATTDVGAIKSTTKMSDNVKIMTKSSESTGKHHLCISIDCKQYYYRYDVNHIFLIFETDFILCKQLQNQHRLEIIIATTLQQIL